MVTIADVATRAGVGAGTVSRVLNNSPNVSADTRARVLAAIEVLDYRPNPLARGLSLGRGHTIGVLVPFFTHASAVERLRGVVAGLHGSDYDLVLLDVESPNHRDEQLATINRQRADGLLVMSLPLPPATLARLMTSGMRVVLVDGRRPGVPCVVTDDVAGGRIGTSHLLELGHERIAFIGDSPDNPFGFPSSRYREQGYREMLAAAGIPVDETYLAYGAHDREVAHGLAMRLLQLDNPPTAIFACSDVQALGAIEAARATGMRVPDDFSVVGFDDIELSSYAGITTVRQPLFKSGKLGARLLLDSLDNGETAPVEHLLDLELVVRTSSAPPAHQRTVSSGQDASTTTSHALANPQAGQP